MRDILKPEYDNQTSLPVDMGYMECDLPTSLSEAIGKMKIAWEKIDAGIEYLRWDCDFCELQSEINTAEVEGIISEDRAWYLREKYLRMERPGDFL